ncbi:MAG: HAD family phosphatase [Lachnospiraceae bacterium]|uniref:HAD family phosphatase n=1 Tax=Candidatus Weimeria bifida TaxID=2599074 RepID=A0A6N7IYW5_9FIRM|nr:HAD family phosphatase [Candidatus Weimeria bifida]RRF96971.1 MAG: HAD family phosphatase [Lachnospiraceae bacterium]
MKKNILEGINAFLFDLDGSLVDSMWMWPAIDREFLLSRGKEVPKDLNDDIDGLSMSDDAKYFKKRFGLADKEEDLIDIWNHMALDHYRNDCPLKPGAGEFIEYLKSEHIKIGLVSSNSRVLVTAATKANGVYDDFDTFVTSEDVLHGKPDPQCYILAAKRLDVEPSSCLVAEDLTVGIRAGKEAGMRVIAVEDEYSAWQDADKKQQADLMISDYRELIP